MNRIDTFFGITSAGSTIRSEILGGLTTFATMSYIILVQPAVLSAAGMNAGSVLLATCLSSAIGCFLMGLFARYPFAQAPGMGQNFLFTYAVCIGMGFSWAQALSLVFLAGLLFLILSLFKLRETLMHALPDCLRYSIGPGIGLFIAFIGFQWGGIVVLDSGTMVAIGELGHAVPLCVLAGVFLSAVLLARGFGGAILVGLASTTILGLITGALKWEVTPSAISTETFFQLDFSGIVERPVQACTAVALLFFLDMFDSVGTLIGVSERAGFLEKDGSLPRAGRAFFSDALATCAGALFGTSTVTTYVESASGVAAGARTGLAAVITGVCFLGAIAAAPLAAVAGQDVAPDYYAMLGIENSFVAMHPAVAPALIIVGLLMMPGLTRIKWSEPTEGLPAFFTLAGMTMGYGITEGISAGCVSFAAMKLLTGRAKEVHPILYIAAVLFLVRYAVQ